MEIDIFYNVIYNGNSSLKWVTPKKGGGEISMTVAEVILVLVDKLLEAEKRKNKEQTQKD